MDDEIQKEADRLMDIINEIAYDKSVPSLMVDCEVANILTENERRLKHQIEMLEGANDAWQKRSVELAHQRQVIKKIHYITAGNIYVFTDVEGEVLVEINELEWYRRAFAVIHNMAAPAVNDE